MRRWGEELDGVRAAASHRPSLLLVMETGICRYKNGGAHNHRPAVMSVAVASRTAGITMSGVYPAIGPPGVPLPSPALAAPKSKASNIVPADG